MITKEKLEELIEQGVKIWNAEWGEEIQLSEKTCSVKKGRFGGFKLVVCENSGGTFRYPLECLFETKEDAEEFAEFGNITRMERLELPSWEEFYNGKFVEFVSNKLLYELKKCGERIYISYRTYIDDSIWEIIFEKPLTRENYNEARRICKKLFLGEDVCKK